MSLPALRVEPQAPSVPRPMDPTFQRWLEGLVWLPEHGMGYYPVTEQPYDGDYFRKYEGYAATEMGRAITAGRVHLVDLYTRGEVVDVGIGCGHFIEARGGETYGFDVNPHGVGWLRNRGLWVDPYERYVEAVTLWDALEHIHEPAELLARVRRWVFLSIPIFRDAEHVIASRHFRRDEHVWYWTTDGLRQWMAAQGFALAYQGDFEVTLGREDIGTFVFRRA